MRHQLRDSEERRRAKDNVINEMRTMVDEAIEKSDKERRLMKLAVAELRSKNVY